MSLSISIHALREEGDSDAYRCATRRPDFNPRPPRGGRPNTRCGAMAGRRFQSTPSARRATTGQGTAEACRLISIHALREEGDPLRPSLPAFALYFNPRPPRGGRHRAVVRDHECRGFQSTPSARRATAAGCCKRSAMRISIHALREEGDSASWTQTWKLCNFNPRPPRGGRPAKRNVEHGKHHISIHALREEGDLVIQPFGQTLEDFNPRPPRGGRLNCTGHSMTPALFQSTPSARRATFSLSSNGTVNLFQSTPSARRATQPTSQSKLFHMISIHALREEGDSKSPEKKAISRTFQSTPSARRATRPETALQAGRPISIHALREEGDRTGRRQSALQSDFNPRPPRGGRLGYMFFVICHCNISIHALREEGDLIAIRCPPMYSDFNPRPPRGGRPNVLGTIVGWVSFQSTPSARRATAGIKAIGHRTIISIHALREESDLWQATTSCLRWYFNPRPPRGERRGNSDITAETHLISIHALREESDNSHFVFLLLLALFQSTPSARRATAGPTGRCAVRKDFNPRPPRGGRRFASWAASSGV